MKTGLYLLLLVFACAALRGDETQTYLGRLRSILTGQLRTGNPQVQSRDSAIRPGAPDALNNLAVMYYQVRKYSDAFDTAAKIWADHAEDEIGSTHCRHGSGAN